MITPSSNTCLEPVTYRILAGHRDVTVHFARVRVTRIGVDAESDRQFSAEAMVAAARQLADADVSVIAWNGTSGSWLGVDHDIGLVAEVGAATGIATTTTTLAMLSALSAYGVTRLGLATPYTPDVNERIVAEYRTHGVEVVATSALGISDNEAFARVPEETVARQVREVADGAQAVAVLCTNVHGAALAQPLEAELGIPVLDSVSVTLWSTRALAGVPAPLPGWGTLLRDGVVHERLQAVTQRLLDATGADRTTIRLDLPAHGLHVDAAAAESLRPGMRPIRRETSLDQRKLATVEWLEDHRGVLVQPHFHADPQPPEALVTIYGVHAQMLGAVEREGAMAGWISAHSAAERTWSDTDLEAMNRARAEVEAVLGTCDNH